MREVLFRGERVDNGEWVEGYVVKWADESVTIDSGSWAHPAYAVKPTTVGQYIGLTDKNGKRIFEGDIIRIPDDYDEFGHNAGEVYAIYFAYGGFRMKPKYGKGARGYWVEDDNIFDVIGNIHDDPELLEDET